MYIEVRKTRAENRFMITLPALTEFEYTAPALVTKVCIYIYMSINMCIHCILSICAM